MATTRPDARETTGTLRAISGVTVLVTANAENASRAIAVASGYWSGCSTVTRAASGPGTTVTGGGASWAGFPCAAPHPARASSEEIEIRGKKILQPLIFISLESILPRQTLPTLSLM